MPGVGSFTGSLLADPREVQADGNTLWIADARNGLLTTTAGTFQRIAPEGPTRDQFAQLYTYAQTLVALPNGPQETTSLTQNQPPVELLSVPSERWISNLVTGSTRGFNSAAYVTTEQKLYLGNFGGGLWSQNEGQPPTPVALPATISLSSTAWLPTSTEIYGSQRAEPMPSRPPYTFDEPMDNINPSRL